MFAGMKQKGKPKLFLIQACRGRQQQDKVEVSNGSQPISHDELLTFPEKRHLDDEILLQPTLEQEQSPYSSRDNNSDAFYNYKENMHKVPEDADVIVAYATTPGYRSIRHIYEGSFFIRAFLSVATKRYKDDDIEKILRAVRRELATNPEFEPQIGFFAGKCQMGMLESTSTKEFYL